MSLGPSTIYTETKKRLALSLFNRATYSRCKYLLKDLNNDPQIDLTIIVGSALLAEEYGSGIETIRKEIKDARIEEIPCNILQDSPIRAGLASAEILEKLSRFLGNNRFDAFIVVGDRFETLPAAYAAALVNIPIIHIQGGEITGNIDEIVRHSVTKLSSYHFVATEMAKRYVCDMGEERSRVFLTGCPGIDTIRKNRIYRKKAREKFIVCQFHPHTKEINSLYDQTKILLESVVDYCTKEGVHCYWYWPNPDPGREKVLELIEDAHKEYKAFLIKAINKPPESFLFQLAHAKFLIGNSSAGIRECSFMGVPAINLGDRQMLRERSFNLIDCDFNKEEILKAMYIQHNTYKYPQSKLYGDGRASIAMMKHIKRLDFTIKDTLTYPMKYEYKKFHFGEERFDRHTKKRQYHSTSI